jgi:hypothetical protein
MTETVAAVAAVAAVAVAVLAVLAIPQAQACGAWKLSSPTQVGECGLGLGNVVWMGFS